MAIASMARQFLFPIFGRFTLSLIYCGSVVCGTEVVLPSHSKCFVPIDVIVTQTCIYLTRLRIYSMCSSCTDIAKTIEYHHHNQHQQLGWSQVGEGMDQGERVSRRVMHGIVRGLVCLFHMDRHPGCMLSVLPLLWAKRLSMVCTCTVPFPPPNPLACSDCVTHALSCLAHLPIFMPLCW